MSLRFEDPPERSKRRQLRWWPLLVELLDNPGQWVRVATLRDAYQAQNAIRSLRQRKVKYPEGLFTFTADGAKIYAKYLGPSER